MFFCVILQAILEISINSPSTQNCIDIELFRHAEHVKCQYSMSEVGGVVTM